MSMVRVPVEAVLLIDEGSGRLRAVLSPQAHQRRVDRSVQVLRDILDNILGGKGKDAEIRCHTRHWSLSSRA